MRMSPEGFIRAVSLIRIGDVFNPYADRCPVHDVADAPQIRKATLLAMLNAAIEVDIESIWIGRDLGYRGGRRTGLALTDDAHIVAHTSRWRISAARPTRGEAVGERTASVIWEILSSVEDRLFLWNVFPFHPHESGNPFSNRLHNAKERAVGEDILAQLVLMLRPARLICIGNDAANVGRRVAGNRDVIKIRHPSYGGQTDFQKQIRRSYGLEFP